MRYFYAILLFLVVAVLAIAGFRGQLSKKPPVLLFGDMHEQPKFRAQDSSSLFPDRRADRPAVPGTVPFVNAKQETYPFLAPRDRFREDRYLTTGEIGDGSVGETDFGAGFPIRITHELMLQGERRYEIHCAVCHGRTGNGEGITRQYGMIATPSFHDTRLREMSDGEIYSVIVHGRGTMGEYGSKLTVEERWAVTAYVRALQLAGHASPEDVPEALREGMGL